MIVYSNMSSNIFENSAEAGSPFCVALEVHFDALYTSCSEYYNGAILEDLMGSQGEFEATWTVRVECSGQPGTSGFPFMWTTANEMNKHKNSFG